MMSITNNVQGEPEMIDFKYNNGGRKKAGYKKVHVGDCVTRALSVWKDEAEYGDGSTYKAIYKEMANANKAWTGKRTARNGVMPHVYATVYKKHGLKMIKLDEKMTISEVYERYGNCLARYTKHIMAVIDGAVHDTWDSRYFKTKKHGTVETKVKEVWVEA